jgi:hypothetical protein
MTMILTGFPPKTCGNDEQKQAVKIVILGLDPGIQSLFNLNAKEGEVLTVKIIGRILVFSHFKWVKSLSLEGRRQGEGD